MLLCVNLERCPCRCDDVESLDTGSWAAQAAPNPKHMSLQRHKDIEEFVVTEAGLGVLWP